MIPVSFVQNTIPAENSIYVPPKKRWMMAEKVESAVTCAMPLQSMEISPEITVPIEDSKGKSRRWTRDDRNELKELVFDKTDVEEIARKTQRTRSAVTNRISILRQSTPHLGPAINRKSNKSQRYDWNIWCGFLIELRLRHHINYTDIEKMTGIPSKSLSDRCLDIFEDGAEGKEGRALVKNIKGKSFETLSTRDRTRLLKLAEELKTIASWANKVD